MHVLLDILVGVFVSFIEQRDLICKMFSIYDAFVDGFITAAVVYFVHVTVLEAFAQFHPITSLHSCAPTF